MPHHDVTMYTVRKLLTLVPPISHLNLLGTPIADEAIFEMLSKEPSSSTIWRPSSIPLCLNTTQLLHTRLHSPFPAFYAPSWVEVAALRCHSSPHRKLSRYSSNSLLGCSGRGRLRGQRDPCPSFLYSAKGIWMRRDGHCSCQKRRIRSAAC